MLVKSRSTGGHKKSIFAGAGSSLSSPFPILLSGAASLGLPIRLEFRSPPFSSESGPFPFPEPRAYSDRRLAEILALERMSVAANVYLFRAPPRWLLARDFANSGGPGYLGLMLPDRRKLWSARL